MINRSKDAQPVPVTSPIIRKNGTDYVLASCPMLDESEPVFVALINRLVPSVQTREIDIYGEKDSEGIRHKIGSKSVEMVNNATCYCCGTDLTKSQSIRTSLGLSEDYSLVTDPDGCCRRCQLVQRSNDNGKGKKGKRK